MIKSKVVRCFVAVEIPEAIQRLLPPIQEALRPKMGKASWTKPGNFHLTLKFLGDIHHEAIGEVSQAVQAVAETQVPFSMEIGGIGAFPNLIRPRVVWVGVKRGASAVAQLAEAVDLQLVQLGYPSSFSRNEQFHAHLTLARLRSRINLKPFTTLFRKYDTIDSATLTVNEITLMRSQLHPKGAIYSPLNVMSFCPIDAIS